MTKINLKKEKRKLKKGDVFFDDMDQVGIYLGFLDGAFNFYYFKNKELQKFIPSEECNSPEMCINFTERSLVKIYNEIEIRVKE